MCANKRTVIGHDENGPMLALANRERITVAVMTTCGIAIAAKLAAIAIRLLSR